MTVNYRSITELTYYKKKYKYKCKVSEKWGRQTLSLPFHLKINNKDIDYIYSKLNFFFKEIKVMVNFSVIIPTHNRNIFLNRAIKSTLAQKKKPLEILVIDDCDNSETKKVINKFIKSHKHTSIKYLKNKIQNNALISRNLE